MGTAYRVGDQENMHFCIRIHLNPVFMEPVKDVWNWQLCSGLQIHPDQEGQMRRANIWPSRRITLQEIKMVTSRKIKTRFSVLFLSIMILLGAIIMSKYYHTGTINFLVDTLQAIKYNYPLFIFLIVSFLLMKVEIEYNNEFIEIYFPFRFWAKKVIFSIDTVKVVEYGGGKAEWLEIIISSTDGETKYNFEFYSFRFKEMKDLIEKVKELIAKKNNLKV